MTFHLVCVLQSYLLCCQLLLLQQATGTYLTVLVLVVCGLDVHGSLIVLCRVPPVVTLVAAEVDLAEEEAEAVVAVASMVVEVDHTVLHLSCHQSCRVHLDYCLKSSLPELCWWNALQLCCQCACICANLHLAFAHIMHLFTLYVNAALRVQSRCDRVFFSSLAVQNRLLCELFLVMSHQGSCSSFCRWRRRRTSWWRRIQWWRRI